MIDTGALVAFGWAGAAILLGAIAARQGSLPLKRWTAGLVLGSLYFGWGAIFIGMTPIVLLGIIPVSVFGGTVKTIWEILLIVVTPIAGLYYGVAAFRSAYADPERFFKRLPRP